MKFSKTAGSILFTLFLFSFALAQTSSSGNPSSSPAGPGTNKGTAQTRTPTGQGAAPPSRAQGERERERGQSQEADRPGNSQPAKPANAPPPESAVPSTAAVITIEGLCETPAPSLVKQPAKTEPQFCRTQISRAEFEKLLSAVAPPNPSPEIRKSVANTYGRLLTLAREGDKLEVEKDPKFQEQLQIFKLQLKAQSAQRKIDAESSNISDADLKAYYDANSSAYEEATLDRVFIPKSSQGASRSPDTANANAAASNADPKQLADQVREQLLKGDDPGKVQASIFQQLKNQAEAPQTKREHVRRGTSLPPNDEGKVFALKPGEVSEVISDPIGYMVYKMEAKTQLPFETVKNDIRTALVSQRMKDRMTTIMNATKTELNEAYFGPPPSTESTAPAQGRPVQPLSVPKSSSQTPKAPATTPPPKQ